MRFFSWSYQTLGLCGVVDNLCRDLGVEGLRMKESGLEA